MNTDEQPITSHIQYPSGRLANMGENLRMLADNDSTYVAPCRPNSVRPTVNAVCMPTNKDVLKNRRNMCRIMGLVSQNEPRTMIVLCSGLAKKEDVERLAQNFPALNLLAIDGPFEADSEYPFETANSALSHGYTRDAGTKRNVALMIARKMGWNSILFLDDDILINNEQLWKAADLLTKGASVVAYSVRRFPDFSVVNHASRWAHTPVDTFMGSGAMAVKTDGPLLPFFPNIYNEDWLFMIAYSLYDNGLIWAGTTKQQKYNPFQVAQKAQNEEPGDLLAESLMTLTMQLKRNGTDPIPFQDGMAKVLHIAREPFWHKEIITRVIFIRTIMEDVMKSRASLWVKRRILRSLDTALKVLIGQHGDNGIKPEQIIEWLHAWARDMKGWNELNQATEPAGTIVEACKAINPNRAFIYRHGVIPEEVSSTDEQTIKQSHDTKALLANLPPRPRTGRVARGLEATAVLQQYLAEHALGLSDISNSALYLRNDRPTSSPDQPKPRATVVMFVAAGESPDRIRQTLEDIIRWNGKKRTIELILWVYERNGPLAKSTLAYRERLIAPLLVVAAGSSIRVRSSVIHDTSPYRLDQVIDQGLARIAFAYWKYDIPPSSHPIIVINSHGEPLRRGTLLQFMERKHWVPNKTLASYLSELPNDPVSKQKSPSETFTKETDLNAIIETYRNITRIDLHPTFSKLTLPRPNPAKQLERAMKKLGISLLELDDCAFGLKLHNTRDHALIGTVQRLHGILVAQGGNAVESAQAVISRLDALKKTAQPTNVMPIVVASAKDDLGTVEAFRIELMRHVQKYRLPKNYILSSLVYVEPKSHKRKHLMAVLHYIHWLENHNSPRKFPKPPKVTIHTL